MMTPYSDSPYKSESSPPGVLKSKGMLTKHDLAPLIMCAERVLGILKPHSWDRVSNAGNHSSRFRISAQEEEHSLLRALEGYDQAFAGKVVKALRLHQPNMINLHSPMFWECLRCRMFWCNSGIQLP